MDIFKKVKITGRTGQTGSMSLKKLLENGLTN